MKNKFTFLRKMALLLCGLMVTAMLSAAEGDVFVVDNIKYTVTSETPAEAEVSGFDVVANGVASLVIPATVIDSSINVVTTEYSVVALGGFSTVLAKDDGDAANNVVTSVSLPSSVKTISDFAFHYNENLASINLENVVTVGKGFQQCISLTDVDLSSCTVLGDYAFNLCEGFVTIETPVLETMGNGSLLSMVNLLKYNVPSTLTSISKNFLAKNTGLKAVQLNWAHPDDATIDGANFFRNLDKSSIKVYVPAGTDTAYQNHDVWGTFPDSCIIEGDMPVIADKFVDNNIEYIITSESPNEVEVSGFDGASTSTLTIPATVTYPVNSQAYSVVSVGASAFKSDAVLDTVNLPESVVVLKTEAFSSITTLKFIDLADVVTIESKAVNGCVSLNDLGGPLAKCTSLGDYAFNQSLRKVTSFVMPVMETIGSGAIYESNGGKDIAFTSIDIPASVNDIGSLFLGRCHNLTEVQVHWTDTIADIITINSNNFFRDVDLTGITLYVPEGKKTMYEEHTLWGQFTHANIIEDVSTGLKPVQAPSLSLYPNPTENGVITIGGEAGQILNVEIFSLSGAVVFQQSVLSQEPISTDLSSGLYMVRVNNATQKLIVK